MRSMSLKRKRLPSRSSKRRRKSKSRKRKTSTPSRRKSCRRKRRGASRKRSSRSRSKRRRRRSKRRMSKSMKLGLGLGLGLGIPASAGIGYGIYKLIQGRKKNKNLSNRLDDFNNRVDDLVDRKFVVSPVNNSARPTNTWEIEDPYAFPEEPPSPPINIPDETFSEEEPLSPPNPVNIPKKKMKKIRKLGKFLDNIDSKQDQGKRKLLLDKLDKDRLKRKWPNEQHDYYVGYDDLKKTYQPSNFKYFTMMEDQSFIKDFLRNPKTYRHRVKRGASMYMRRPIRLRKVHELIGDEKLLLTLACLYPLSRLNYHILDVVAMEIAAHFDNTYDIRLITQDISEIKNVAKLKRISEDILNKKSFLSVKLGIPGHAMAFFIVRDLGGNDEVIVYDPNGKFFEHKEVFADKKKLTKQNFRSRVLSKVYEKNNEIKIKSWIFHKVCINTGVDFKRTCSIPNESGGVCSFLSQFAMYMLLSSGVRPSCIVKMIRSGFKPKSYPGWYSRRIGEDKFIFLFALYHGEIVRIYTALQAHPELDRKLHERLMLANHSSVAMVHKNLYVLRHLPSLDPNKDGVDVKKFPRNEFTAEEVKAFKQGSVEANAACGMLPKKYEFRQLEAV